MRRRKTSENFWALTFERPLGQRPEHLRDLRFANEGRPYALRRSSVGVSRDAHPGAAVCRVASAAAFLRKFERLSLQAERAADNECPRRATATTPNSLTFGNARPLIGVDGLRGRSPESPSSRARDQQRHARDVTSDELIAAALLSLVLRTTCRVAVM